MGVRLTARSQGSLRIFGSIHVGYIKSESSLGKDHVSPPCDHDHADDATEATDVHVPSIADGQCHAQA